MEIAVAKLEAMEDKGNRRSFKFSGVGYVSEFAVDGVFVMSKDASLGKTYKVHYEVNGKYKNLKATLVETDEAPTQTSSKDNRDDDYWKEKDRKMVWLGCLKDSIEACKLLKESGHLTDINLGTIQGVANTFLDAIENGKDKLNFEFEKFYVPEEKVK